MKTFSRVNQTWPENGREETGDRPRTRNFVEGGHATAVNARASVNGVNAEKKQRAAAASGVNASTR